MLTVLYLAKPCVSADVFSKLPLSFFGFWIAIFSSYIEFSYFEALKRPRRFRCARLHDMSDSVTRVSETFGPLVRCSYIFILGFITAVFSLPYGKDRQLLLGL
jgi:hypothetical protein